MLLPLEMRCGENSADPLFICFIRNMVQEQPAQYHNFTWAQKAVDVPVLFS